MRLILLDLILDNNEFLDEIVHGRVNNFVGRHECFEVVGVENVDVGGEVVFRLNKFELGFESRVLLSKSAELLLLIPVDLLGLINELCQVVGDFGLLFDLGLKLGDDLSGLAVPLLVLLELYVGLQHLLVKFKLLLEQVIVLLLLLVELDGEFMVVLLGGLLLRDQLLHLDVLVALQLGLQTLDGHVLAGKGLFLELLVLDLGEALGLGQLVLLLAQVLSNVLKLLHLDLLHLQVDTRIEDLIAQLGFLS